MPTYEYRCQSCSDEIEAFQPISAPPLTTCGKCGGSLKKLISKGGGFIVRGSTSGTPRAQAGCSKPACGGCHACK